MTQIKLPRRLSPVALGVLMALAAMARPVMADAPPGSPGLRPVIISASRHEQVGDDLPAAVDVLTRDDIEASQSQDIRDLVRELPNLSVRQAPMRFAITGPANNTGREGQAGINIRGLGGNRVLLMVDGVRVPHSYVYAGNAFGRDYFSMELYRRVEVVRGPASVLYGSEGLAGLVNFITHEPADFLGPDRRLGGRVALGWTGDDGGLGLGGTLAGRVGDRVEWLVTATGRRAHGLRTMGTVDTPDVDRTTANPQTDHDQSLLAKVVIRPGGGSRHVLTAEHTGKRSSVDLLSSRARLPLTGTAAQVAAAVIDEYASSDKARDRLTWEARYRADSALADQVQTVLAVQHAASRQLGSSDLQARPDRFRDTRYTEHTWQAGFQADRLWRLSPDWVRKLTWGVDWVRSDVTNLYTGLNPLAPEVFPLKRFPDTRETQTGLYAQMEWVGERWSLVPGLRLDHFAVDVRSQDGFYPPAKLPARSLAGSAATPKLGVLYRASPAWTLFGNVAGGFRAPNANQVNGYYENTAEQVVIVPNPDLKPERSHGLELGARGRFERLSVDVTAFDSRFRHLIVDNVLISGTGVVGDPKLFQTRNLDRARIRGLEIRGQVDWGRIGDGRLGLPFSLGLARGTNLGNGLPLNSVDPARLSVGLDYATAGWSVRLDVRHHAAKRAEDIDSAGLVKPPARQVALPAATTLDLRGQWRLRRDLRLNWGIGNLTNRKHWLWSDVQGLASSTTVLDAYSQPGRHVNLSLVADF